jgi:AraC family transcriptional regulator, transcriptional activator of pobA
MKNTRQILHFDDINESHEAIGFVGRTDLPDFHLFTLEETYPSTKKVMPPYTFRFYCVTFLENSADALLEVNAEQKLGHSDMLAFQSPGHVVAWVRGKEQRGFIVYFQPEFLSHHPKGTREEFPFFQTTEINVFPISAEDKANLKDHLLHLNKTFKHSHPYRTQKLQALLLAFLFDCKALYENYRSSLEQQGTKSSLVTRFQQLLEQHYLTKQSIKEYAAMLHVSPNHLSQVVSSSLGHKASNLITDRVLLEAKKLLRYSDLSIAEIGDYLGFSEPTHFTRFFKRNTDVKPLEYRQQAH